MEYAATITKSPGPGIMNLADGLLFSFKISEKNSKIIIFAELSQEFMTFSYGQSGIIPRTYETGGLMPIEIQITAHHQGFFEFRLCETNGVIEDPSCFKDERSLMMLDNGSTKYSITDFKPTRPGQTGWWYSFNALIPSNIECDHCTLQWRYHTANSWGSDESGTGIGYGAEAYHFFSSGHCPLSLLASTYLIKLVV